MRIGILGTGEVGQALGTGFVARGHEVKLGSRDASNEKGKAWSAKHGAKASSGTFADAASFGEVLVLCTLWSGTKSALDMAGAKNMAGKVVMDVTNPLVFAPNQPPALALGHTDSGGEQVQRWLPDSRVVKAFNIVGNKNMVDPTFPDGPPDMFICGNDDGAKQTVTRFAKDFGWPVTDLGGIEVSRVLEPLCILWVLYGTRTGGWDHALKMLRK